MPVYDHDQPKEITMRFTPKTEEQLVEESLIPAGEYDFCVVSAAEKKSKSGNDMIVVELDIFVNGNARPLRDFLMEAMAFKLRHFCEATGLIEKYNNGTLTALDCENKSGKLKIVIQDSPQYGKQNQVKDYIKDAKPEAGPIKKQVVPAASPAHDEPPF